MDSIELCVRLVMTIGFLAGIAYGVANDNFRE